MANDIFNSSVLGTPAVSVQGAEGADGICATTDDHTDHATSRLVKRVGT